MSDLSRRKFIKNAVVTTAGTSLLPSSITLGASRHAHRLIFVYYPNGAVLRNWHPDRFNLRYRRGDIISPSFAPLAPFADRIITLRNLTSKGHGGSSSHPEAASGIFSGGWRGAPSIDTVIGNQLSSGVRLDYQHFGLFTRYNKGKDYLPFRDQAGQPILPEDDPRKLSSYLFPNSNEDNDFTEAKAFALERLAQLSSSPLPSDVALKLDNHRRALLNFQSQPSSSCGIKEILGMVSDRRQNNLIGERLAKAQIRLLVNTLKCQLTRVCTLQFLSAEDESMYINFDSIRERLDRSDGGGFGSDRKWWNQNLSHPSSHEANQVFQVQNEWYNSMVADLCGQLDAIPDPQGGGSLLDTSIICVGSEVGESATHGQEDLPWYLVGGANGRFDTGRDFNCAGLGTSDLQLELARVMGLNWSSFGNSSVGITGLYRA